MSRKLKAHTHIHWLRVERDAISARWLTKALSTYKREASTTATMTLHVAGYIRAYVSK